MRRPLPLLLGLAAAAPALGAGCGVATWAPTPVALDDPGGTAAALLLAPAHWERGDPAVVLLGAAAFRLGCADRLAALLLEGGVLVLAVAEDAAQPGAEDAALPARLAVAGRLLLVGFGAGSVAALRPVAGAR